jgi:hypothetical protein
MPRLIALYSPAPQCGKTTIASHLRDNHGFVQLDFSNIAKIMIYGLLFESREVVSTSSARRVDQMMSERFTQTDLPHFPTPAHLVRTLEEEWGDQCIGPDFWAELWYRRAKSLLESGASVVCSDLRNAKHLAAVKSLKGQYWRITRPGYAAKPTLDGRSSDGALDGLPLLWHNIIPNDGTEEMLLQYVDTVMSMEVVS